jgi:hypothetical protein
VQEDARLFSFGLCAIEVLVLVIELVSKQFFSFLFFSFFFFFGVYS